jgi:tight adherence protein C
VTATLPAVLAAFAAAIGWIAIGAIHVDGAAARIRPLPGAPVRADRIATQWRGPSAIRWLGGAVALLGVLLAPSPGILLAPVLLLIGWRLPALLDRRSARRRAAAADAQIPQLLDLLAAGSSAGLSGQLAFRRAVDALGGPLAAELRGALDAVDLGARWRDELAAVSARLDLPDLRRTVNALSRTETLGASLSGSTAELAASVRAARRAAVTERARTAPVKMLFPLVFLVLPAFLLLTVVPVLLTTLRSIH